MLDYGVKERVEFKMALSVLILGSRKMVWCLLRENYRSSHEKNSMRPVLDNVEYEVPDKPLNGDLKRGNNIWIWSQEKKYTILEGDT